MESTGTTSAATTDPTTEKPPDTTELKMPPAGAKMADAKSLALAPSRDIHSVVVRGTLTPCWVSQGSADAISAEILPGSSEATVATSLATTGSTSATKVAMAPSTTSSTMAMPRARGMRQLSRRSISGFKTYAIANAKKSG